MSCCSETCKVKKIIELQGTEFDDMSEDELDEWVCLMKPFVSKKQFGNLYSHALAYLIMHKWKMAGLGENPLGDIGKVGVGFGIGSVSEGGSSISFGAGQSSNLANDAELGLTAYGLQYLSLRRMCVIPIHCSGESDNDESYIQFWERV